MARTIVTGRSAPASWTALGATRRDPAAPSPGQPGGQGGFAMAALLVSLAIMSVLLTVALPVWNHAAKREREAELIFRGEQYARAIMLYQRQTPGAYPPDLDTLVEGRFLRRKYRDPMTEHGEFRLILQSEASGLAGEDEEEEQEEEAADASRGAMQGLRPFSGAGNAGGFPDGFVPFGDRDDQRSGGAEGNIAGVVSESTETSIALYKGRSQYNEWEFLPVAAGAPAGGDSDELGVADGLGQPFGNRPGRGGGTGGSRGLSRIESGSSRFGRGR